MDANRVRESFARQGMMATLGAELTQVGPGEMEIAMVPSPAFTQQNGFQHAAAIAAIMDSACGYAAYSLMDTGSDALTVEFKINLLRPAAGTRFIARAKVVKPGRTLSFCEATCHAETGDGEKLIATMQNTVMTIKPREA